MKYLDYLNERQKEAATFVDGSLLILAGAGTGKTQTMISRIVYLISEIGISADSILALTFTNKAANSMKERAINMLNDIGYQGAMPKLGTFHSFGMEFLSEYVKLLDGIRRPNFRVIDTDDRKEIIKSAVLEIKRKDDKDFYQKDKDKAKYEGDKEEFTELVKEATKYIDRCKNTIEYNLSDEFNHAVYLAYESELELRNLIDFDDLIVLPYLILKNNAATAKKISNEYSYIMVDEYQDTNLAQLKLLKELTCEHNNIVVVGDDDQSIYSFRHARIDNILGFANDFKGAKIIKLEENYRSTKEILDCANYVISLNKNRYGKELFTNNQENEEITAITDLNFICDEIKRLVARGIKYNDICVCYRMNLSANYFEPKLINAQIPYKVIGSVPFYSRAEIKLLIHYLRLYIDNNENYSFKKIINSPKRGFGEKALMKLEELAGNNSLFTTLKNNLDSFKNTKIKEFVELFENTRNKFALFLEKLYILEVHKMFEKPKEREENCNVFFDIIKRECGFNADVTKLIDLLNKITLQEQLTKEQSNAVNLMSIHASKGLEYEYVFLIDCNNGNMPCTKMGVVDYEEERRLLYVAITRAKKKFYLHYDETNPSVYVNNILRYKNNDEIINDYYELNDFKSDDNIKIGSLAKHKIFGYGKVVAIENNTITVNFQGSIKKLNKSFLTF